LRDRPDRTATGACRSSARRDRSLEPDAEPGACPGPARTTDRPGAFDPRRHQEPAVRVCVRSGHCEVAKPGAHWRARRGRILHGARALRTPAVTPPRTRPHGGAFRDSPCPAAGRHIWHGARCRPSCLGGVSSARQLEGMAQQAGRLARDTGRNRSPGSRKTPHDLRSGVHRTPRWPPSNTSICVVVPHALSASDVAASREGRVRSHSPARRLSWRPRDPKGKGQRAKVKGEVKRRVWRRGPRLPSW
jgi:hypothetical protein